jgi:hypothetical protein
VGSEFLTPGLCRLSGKIPNHSLDQSQETMFLLILHSMMSDGPLYVYAWHVHVETLTHRLTQTHTNSLHVLCPSGSGTLPPFHLWLPFDTCAHARSTKFVAHVRCLVIPTAHAKLCIAVVCHLSPEPSFQFTCCCMKGLLPFVPAKLPPP